MKIFSKIIVSKVMFFLLLVQITPVWAFSPLKKIKGAAEKVKQTASSTVDKVQDKVEAVGDEIKDTAKDVAQGAKKVAGKVADKVEDLGGDVAKKLQELGFPNPKDLVKYAFSKMPKSAIKKLVMELFDFSTAVGADFNKTMGPVTKALDILYEPIPPLPTGIPLPLPSTPPGLPTAINAAIGISQSIVISRLQKQSLNFLQAFHSVTKYKYFTEDDKKLFLAKIEEPAKKKYLSKAVNLNKVGEKLQDAAKTARKPVEILRKIIEKVAPELLKEIEPLKRNVEPVPLMALLPLGDSYNGSVFCFRLKQHKDHLNAIEWRLKNNLKPLPKKDFIPLEKLRKDRVMGAILKIVENNPIRNIEPIKVMNEMFVDHLHKLPWGTHSNIILFLKILNLLTEALDSVTSAIIAAIVNVVSVGAAAGASEAIASVAKEVINFDFVFEFVSTIFKWGYIRYLEARFYSIDALIERVRADDASFDSELFIQELARIEAGQGPTNPIPGSVEDGAATPSPVKPMTKPLEIVIPVAKDESAQKAPEKKEEPLQKSDVVEPVVAVKKEPTLEKETTFLIVSDKLSGDKGISLEPTALTLSAVQPIVETVIPVAPETEKTDARSAGEVSQVTEIEKMVKSPRAKAKKVVRKLKKRRKQKKVRRRRKKAKKMIKKKNRHKKKNIKRNKKRLKNKFAKDVVKFDQWLAGVNQ